MRLDAYITIKNSSISRSRAKALIEAGSVTLDGRVITKPSFAVDDALEHSLELDLNEMPYVSRGGLKLEGALNSFDVDPAGRVCADIGSSTGGFTDCLLQRGAARVYAVDSGTDQLAESLRADPRVRLYEQFNARSLTESTFGEACSLAVGDLSFISQTYVLAPIASILSPNGEYIGLIKPQFECGRGALGKGGIVKDTSEHFKAVRRVLDSAEDVGFEVQSVAYSPIRGGDGNVEFLFHAVKKDGEIISYPDERIKELIKNGKK